MDYRQCVSFLAAVSALFIVFVSPTTTTTLAQCLTKRLETLRTLSGEGNCSLGWRYNVSLHTNANTDTHARTDTNTHTRTQTHTHETRCINSILVSRWTEIVWISMNAPRISIAASTTILASISLETQVSELGKQRVALD